MELKSLPEFIQRQFPYAREKAKTSWGPMGYAYVGEGRPVLLLHGNPTWGFLYRHVMRELEGKKLKLIAPDLIGFGTSYKPKNLADHTLRRHGQALRDFVVELNLKEIILVVQDWGGPIGLWMVSELKERVKALLVLNTAVIKPARFRTTPFHRFAQIPLVSNMIFYSMAFPVPVMHLAQGDRKSISKEAKRAYFWPFRRFSDRAAPLALARMVPNRPNHPTVAEMDKVDAAFRHFSGPLAFCWGTKDPVLGRAFAKHRKLFPHAPCELTEAGHFLQEEVPEKIAQMVLELHRKS